MISVEGVTLRFGGLVALNDVHMTIPRGGIVGIIGPNGAGKTSLLNCINGSYRPSGGTITIDSQAIIGKRPSEIAKLGVGRTFQSVQLLPETSVLENVLLGRHVRQRRNVFAALAYLGPGRREEQRQRQFVVEILDRLGMTDMRNREAGSLPYGVQRLVEIARVLASEPQVLLLDEPTSGMNRRERTEIARVVRSLSTERGLTQVVVEHDVRFITELCDTVVVLNFGQVIATGPPVDVLSNEHVVEAYLGRSDKNSVT